MRREERHGGIAPIVDSSRRAILLVEMEHGQEFNRGDAEFFKIRNFFDQTRIRAAGFLRDARTGMAGKPAHVHLIHDGSGGRSLERRIAFPIVRLHIHDHALHGGCAIVSRLGCGDAAVLLRHRHSPAIGIEQDLLMVKSQSSLRLKRPVCAIAVDLARSKPRDEDMPIVVRPVSPGVEGNDGGRFGIIRVIEQQQFHERAILRKHAEVHSLRGNGRPEGKTFSWSVCSGLPTHFPFDPFFLVLKHGFPPSGRDPHAQP